MTNTIDLRKIDVNPYNPRTDFDQEGLDELADSIKQWGIIQPITVREIENGRYQIISGERRYRASQQAGLTEIPAYVRQTDDNDMLLLALLENTQRKDLDAIEVAISYQRLTDEYQLTQEEISAKVGKQRSTVTNYLRLLKLPYNLQIAIRQRQLSMGHARPLVNIEQEDLQLRLMQEIIDEDLSVREVEKRARQYTQPETVTADAPDKPEDPDEKVIYEDPAKPVVIADDETEPYVKERLSSYFSAKVDLKRDNSGAGRIVIHFRTDEEFLHIRQMIDKISNE